MKYSLVLVLLALAGGGCSTSNKTSPAQGSNLTHGAVQLYLKKGETNQAQVLEKFGAPNIVTIDGTGLEVWTYQKHSMVAESSNSYGTLIILGGSKSGFEQSSRTMTLIIKFDSQKIISDFSSMYTSF